MTDKEKLKALYAQLKEAKKALAALAEANKANPSLKIFNAPLVKGFKAGIAAIEHAIKEQAAVIKQQEKIAIPQENDSLVKKENLECVADYDQNVMTEGKWKSMKADFKTHLRGWLSAAATSAEQIERLVLDGKEKEEESDVALIVISILLDGLGPVFKGLKIISKYGNEIADAVSAIATSISKEVYSKVHNGITSSGSGGKITIREFTYDWVKNFKDFVENSDKYFDDLQNKLQKGCGGEITEGVVNQVMVDIINSLPDTKKLEKILPVLWVKASADDGMDGGDLTDLKAGHIIVKFKYDADDNSFSLLEAPFIDDVPAGTTHMIQKSFKGQSIMSKELADLDIQLHILEMNFMGPTASSATREKGKWGKYEGNIGLIPTAITMLNSVKVDALRPD